MNITKSRLSRSSNRARSAGGQLFSASEKECITLRLSRLDTDAVILSSLLGTKGIVCESAAYKEIKRRVEHCKAFPSIRATGHCTSMAHQWLGSAECIRGGAAEEKNLSFSFAYGWFRYSPTERAYLLNFSRDIRYPWYCTKGMLGISCTLEYRSTVTVQHV